MQLGRHHLESLLAVRPLERVYAGRSVGSQTDAVLVRQLLPGLPAEEIEATAEVFSRHMERMTLLTHPGTLPVREYSQGTEGPFYFVTAVPQGITLGELLTAAGSLPVSVAASIGLELVDRLSHAHDREIWHLGLHRGHVLLAPVAQLSVLDLGVLPLLLERAQGRLRHVHSAWDFLFPDPGTVPPELLSGEELGPHTDVYGVGALLYAMVTAVAPYRGTSVLAYNAILSHGAPRDPRLEIADIDDDFAELVLRCLSRRPEDRPPSMTALREVLTRWAGPLEEALRDYQPVLLPRSYVDRFQPLLRVVEGRQKLPGPSGEPPAPAVVPLFRDPEPGAANEAELLAAMTPEQRRVYMAAARSAAMGNEVPPSRRQQIQRGVALGVILAVIALAFLLPQVMWDEDPAAPGSTPAAAVSTPPRALLMPLRRRPAETEVRPRQRGSIEQHWSNW